MRPNSCNAPVLARARHRILPRPRDVLAALLEAGSPRIPKQYPTLTCSPFQPTTYGLSSQASLSDDRISSRPLRSGSTSRCNASPRFDLLSLLPSDSQPPSSPLSTAWLCPRTTRSLDYARS